MKTMNDDIARKFAYGCIRAESYENMRCFSKGVRATLIELGFDDSWVNNEFREILETMIKDSDVAHKRQ